MTAPISIDFQITGFGSADLEFKIGDRAFRANGISYTTDALGDLLRSAIVIATGGQDVVASFDREPAEWRLQLHSLFDARTGLGPVQIRVLEFDNIYGAKPASEGTEVFIADCSALEFARAVLVTARKAREKFEQFGSDLWPYPDAAVQALQAALDSYGRR